MATWIGEFDRDVYRLFVALINNFLRENPEHAVAKLALSQLAENSEGLAINAINDPESLLLIQPTVDLYVAETYGPYHTGGLFDDE